MPNEFSTRLKIALQKREMKPSELSKRTGINKGTLSRYLHGKGASANNAVTIANVLNVTTDFLFGRTDETN